MGIPSDDQTVPNIIQREAGLSVVIQLDSLLQQITVSTQASFSGSLICLLKPQTTDISCSVRLAVQLVSPKPREFERSNTQISTALFSSIASQIPVLNHWNYHRKSVLDFAAE